MRGAGVSELVEALAVVLVAVAAFAALAGKLGLPEPLVYVLGGAGLALVPGVPTFAYDANAVFLVYFPILLGAAAYTTSWNDFRPNAAVIVPFGIGAVVATTLGVGVVAKAAIPGLTWPLCFMLGVILADPDFRVFNSLASRLEVPRPVRTVLGGEGLVEGTAQITLYLAISAAITTGLFSWSGVFRDIVVGSVVGIAVGLVMAWVVYQVDLRVPDPTISVVLTLLMPFAAYLPAQQLGGNRLAAVAAAGLCLGWLQDVSQSAEFRRTATGFWTVLAFLVNGFVYVPAGMALPGALGGVAGRPLVALVGWVFLLTLAAVAARALWGLGAEVAIRIVRRLLRVRSSGRWSEVVLGAFAPTRGAFAVASSLALPLAVSSGAPFPQRDFLIVLSLGVAVASIAIQSAALPRLIGALDLGDDHRREREENLARRAGAEAALARLEDLVREQSVSDGVANFLRRQYGGRLERYSSTDGRAPEAAPDLLARKQILAAERAALLRLREQNAISDAVFRDLQRELDDIDRYLG